MRHYLAWQPASPVACLCALFSLLLFVGSSAQVTVNAQSFNNSEAQIQDAQKKLDDAAKNQQKAPGYVPPRRFDGGGAVPSGGPTVLVRSVVITGASVFSQDELMPCTAKIKGRAVTEADLFRASSCITGVYQEAGFILSRAVIPPQDMPGGKLVIRVIEGFIRGYQFQGGDGEAFGLHKFADVITAERPLTLKTFEKQLLLINDVAGVVVEDTALAEVGEMSGAYQLTISISSWDLYASSELENRGSEEIGPVESYNSLFLNSLFGRGETIGLGFTTSADDIEELALGQVSVDVPLDAYGLRLSAYLLASRTAPDDIRKSIDTRYKSFETGAALTFVRERSREQSLWLGAGMWFRTTKWETSLAPLVDEQMTGLNVFLRYEKLDQYNGLNLLDISFRQGIDMFNTSREGEGLTSRGDGDGVFSKLTLDYERVQTLDENWSLKVDGFLQLASEGLLSSEEVYFGGRRFGRAFEGGAIGGDSGIAGALELRYTRPLAMDYLESVQLYGFVDVSKILDDANPVMDGALISSAGIGARFSFIDGYYAGVELALPLEDDSFRDEHDQEFFFRIGRNMKLDELGLRRRDGDGYLP